MKAKEKQIIIQEMSSYKPGRKGKVCWIKALLLALVQRETLMEKTSGLEGYDTLSLRTDQKETQLKSQ